MPRSVCALLVLTTTAHAQSVIFTYDQWEQLSTGLQEIYLAGDAISTIAVPTQAGTAKFYNDCLVKNQITAHVIAEEMKTIWKKLHAKNRSTIAPATNSASCAGP